MKNIKWILLIICIISILITIVLFINFDKGYSVPSQDNYDENLDKNNLNDIYNKQWYIMSLIVTDGTKETFKYDSYNSKYVIFKENTIEFCDLSNKKCYSDEYIYRENKILISTDNIFGSGDYDLELIDDKLKLSKKEENEIISYYFGEAKG